MITKNKLIFDILNTARAGKQSDDELFSERQVGFWVDTTRALLIERNLNKNGRVRRELVQSLGCVPVSDVDASDCPCVVADCDIIRTDDKIPIPLNSQGKLMITRVGPIDITKPAFSFIPYQRVPFVSNNKYTKNIPKAFYHDGYIFIVGKGLTKLLQYINIQGIFEFPEEVASFTECDGQACYTNVGDRCLSTYDRRH